MRIIVLRQIFLEDQFIIFLSFVQLLFFCLVEIVQIGSDQGQKLFFQSIYSIKLRNDPFLSKRNIHRQFVHLDRLYLRLFLLRSFILPNFEHIPKVFLTLTMNIFDLLILNTFFLFSLELKILPLHLQKDILQPNLLVLVGLLLQLHAIHTFFQLIEISEGFLHDLIDKVDASVFFNYLRTFFDCIFNVLKEFFVLIELFGYLMKFPEIKLILILHFFELTVFHFPFQIRKFIQTQMQKSMLYPDLIEITLFASLLVHRRFILYVKQRTIISTSLGSIS